MLTADRAPPSWTLAILAAVASFLCAGVACRLEERRPPMRAKPPTAPTTSASPCSSSSTYEDADGGVPRGAGASTPSLAHRPSEPRDRALLRRIRPTKPRRKRASASRAHACRRRSRLTSLGLIARAANRVDEAAAAFRRVLEIDPPTSARSQPRPDSMFSSGGTPRPPTLVRSAARGRTLQRDRGLQPGDRADPRRATPRKARVRWSVSSSCATSGYAATYSQTYLEQGRYAEAIASTGAEAELVDERPDRGHVRRCDRTLIEATVRQPPAGGRFPWLAALPWRISTDDGDLDLVVGAGALRV